MSSFVLTNAFVSVNSVTLSDHVKSVKINYKADTPTNTAMGATAQSRLPSLVDWDLELEFNQDFAGANVDATLFPLVGAAAFPIEIRPTASAKGPTNPSFTGNALLESYAPVSGKVGDVASTSVTLRGTGALTRATS
jgi:hypothetical protein